MSVVLRLVCPCSAPCNDQLRTPEAASPAARSHQVAPLHLFCPAACSGVCSWTALWMGSQVGCGRRRTEGAKRQEPRAFQV